MRISVIIPTLNEEAALPVTLAAVRRQSPHEIIVADGGSTDGTIARAKGLADGIVTGERGRAAQMNRGASSATGDALLFLHADCALEDKSLAEIGHWLKNPNVSAGCFRMFVPGRNPLYRGIGACASARARLFGIVYGDQGLFLRREMFVKAGGFPQLRLMEDVYLSLRLRKMGRVVVARRRITASPRRWQEVGVVRQTLRNWALTALAACGTHPDQLARYYPDVR